MTKTLKQSEDLYVEFTPEELTELGWKVGDKFSCKVENGSIILTKHVSMELDLADWPREALYHLIEESINQDISVNEVITQVLTKQVERFAPHLNEQPK